MTPIDNTFTQFQLTKEELVEATIFNSLQRAYIQNCIAEAAMKKVALTVDSSNINGFIQEEAELQGNILALQALLQLTPPIN